MNKLLLVIDVQNDFINDNTVMVKDKIDKLIESNEYNNVVFTKFINNKNSIWYNKLNYEGCLLEAGQRIAVNTRNYPVFDKYTYSALSIELKDYIEDNNIKSIYLCGFDTDACIYKTALDLFDNNYNVYVLKNYTMSHKGEELHKVFIDNLKRLIGKDHIV